MLVLVEMYVKGLSTHKLEAITEKHCDKTVLSSQVSRAATILDKVSGQ
jgi:transposase-like protein